MDALELKDTTYFLRKKIYRFSMINFPIFNEKWAIITRFRWPHKFDALVYQKMTLNHYKPDSCSLVLFWAIVCLVFAHFPFCIILQLISARLSVIGLLFKLMSYIGKVDISIFQRVISLRLMAKKRKHLEIHPVHIPYKRNKNVGHFLSTSAHGPFT